MRWEELEERARVRLGRTLRGRWTLEALLGVGGTSAVYAATHRNGAPVAIKVLHPSVTAVPEVKARFLREGCLANRVRHPAIVGVLDDDVDEVDGVAFLVMERVEGESLAARGARRLLRDEELLDLAAQVLDALAVAHAAGVVHRDLKPENLLVDDAGRVRILDFGIARLLDAGDDTLVGLGTVCGTPGFLAPEQARGARDEISPRTDLFNLGATLFALASGRTLFEDVTLQRELLRAASESAPRLADVAPHVSADVAAIVDRATRFAPSARWSSAAEMLGAVDHARGARAIVGERVLARGSEELAEEARRHATTLDPQPIRGLVDSCGAIAIESDEAPRRASPARAPARRSWPSRLQPWAIVASAALALGVAVRLAAQHHATISAATTAAAGALNARSTRASRAASIATTAHAIVTANGVAPRAPRDAAPSTSTPATRTTAKRAAPTRAPATTTPKPRARPERRAADARELRDEAPIAVPEGYRESPY